MTKRATSADLFFRVVHGFRGVPVKVLDQCFRLDESLRRWRTDGENVVLENMARILRPGDTFVDVGANFGLHTLFGARQVGPTGHVIAIEPVPANCRLLLRNIQLNKLDDRVRLVAKAASDGTQTELILHGVEEGVSVAATLRLVPDTSASLVVEAITLDHCLANISQPARLIKIDVEGAEHLVLRGATTILREQRPFVLIEMHEFALPDFGTSTEAIRADLEGLGYAEEIIDTVHGVDGRYYHALYTPCDAK